MDDIRMTIDEWLAYNRALVDLMERLDRVVTAASAYRAYINHLQDTGKIPAEHVGELETKEALYGDDIDREFELQTLRYAEDEDE